MGDKNKPINAIEKPMNYCFRQEAGSNVHKLYLYDDITEYGRFNWETWKYDESETSAKHFRDQLEAMSDSDTIELHINSNGGSVKEGVTIYNLLKQKACKKVGYVDGVAYSIAFVILQACDERIMGIGTSALIHNMWVTISGNATDLRKAADDLDTLMESNRKIFMSKGTIEEETLKELMDAETYLTPDQCLEYGLIDKVVDDYSGDAAAAAEALQRANAAMQKAIEERQQLLAKAQQLSDNLRAFRQAAADPEPKDPEPTKKTLMSNLANMMKGM